MLAVAGSAILGKPLLGVVIAIASARFTMNGLYELTAASALETVSGVLGCLIAVIAL